jgi:hypothetical protein
VFNDGSVKKNRQCSMMVDHERDEENPYFNCSGVEHAAIKSHPRFLHL